MKKIIVKHILFVFLFTTILLFLWFLFIFQFFDNELKKTVYPIIQDSKQVLAELVTKDFAKDKVNSFLTDLKESKEILNLTLSNKDKRIYSLNDSQGKETLLSFFKFSYPIKKDDKIVGWIDVWPSYELFITTIVKDKTQIVLLISIIIILFIVILVSYLYITRYIIYPFEQMTKIINSISSDTHSEIKLLPEKGMWKDIFIELKKLNTKVIDVNTTMKLLFSATSVITSDLELTHSIHLIFNIIQKKIDNAICVLFMPSEDGQLKVIAKNGFSLQSIKSISSQSNSPILQCYKKCEPIIIQDVSLFSMGDGFDIFLNENIVMQMNMPLTDENHNCIGVLSINARNKNAFDDDTEETITIVSKYLAALIVHVQDYKRVKEANRKLEAEIQMTSKELINTNAMLIKKVRDIKAISDISSYASTKFDMEDVVKYIIEKTKEILSVETAGVFIYSNIRNEFFSVEGSFGIYDIIKVKNIDKSVFNKIFLSKKPVIVKDREDMKKYCPELLEKVNVNSAIFSPAKADNNIAAVIVAINKIGMDFTESDMKVLEHISIVILSIIEKIELYSKMKADFTK